MNKNNSIRKKIFFKDITFKSILLNQNVISTNENFNTIYDKNKTKQTKLKCSCKNAAVADKITVNGQLNYK